MSLSAKWRLAGFAPAVQTFSAACRAIPHDRIKAIPIVSLFPIIDLDAFPVRTFIHAPPDVAASADHDDVDVVEIRDGCVPRKFQPRSVRLLSGASWPQFIVDDLLIEPIMVLGDGHVLLH